MRVLVLGGYGLIGQAVSTVLAREGHAVVVLGRSRRGAALVPDATFVAADIARLATPAQWRPHLAGIEVVVNASGALQSGVRDDVAAVQYRAIVALVSACAADGPRRFVQISAPGATADATTVFLASKGRADAALKESTLDWTILRPGLVLAPTAHGGTSLLRALAAFPLVQPLLLPDARVQTVAVAEVADAVARAVAGEVRGGPYDLVEDDVHSLREVVLGVRRWLGFAPPRAVVEVPRPIGYGLARLADLAGWLGWRPAARTTALVALEEGVVGDPGPWRAAGGTPPKAFEATLRALPSTAQERLYARWQLVFPIAVVVLSAFWIVSGFVGLARLPAAAAVLTDRLPGAAAVVAVIVGALADVVIGTAFAFRRTVRLAGLAAVAVSAGYLLGATLLVPALWVDPLGALVKVVPAMVLALAVAAMAEER